MPDAFPYTMRLPDGRTLYVELPGEMVKLDRDGSVMLKPDAVRRLDQVRALAMRDTLPVTPAFIATARKTLGLSQAAFAKRIGRSVIAVKRYEAGTLKPGDEVSRKVRSALSRAASRGLAVA